MPVGGEHMSAKEREQINLPNFKIRNCWLTVLTNGFNISRL